MTEVLIKNLFQQIPGQIPQEIQEVLLAADAFRLERIVSRGQATPPGEWYDQESHEWVILLAGGAGLRFEGEAALRVMQPGDYVHLPAHCRHRVEWTDPDRDTIWLALHYQ